MTVFAKIDDLSLSRPDGETLFSGLTLSIAAQRYGLVGRNGCGKSSLLHVLAGEGQPAGGCVQIPGRVHLVQQAIDPALRTVEAALRVTAARARLARIEAGEGDAEDFANADWTLETRLNEALAVCGLPELDLDRAVSTMSGGERMRLMLARAMLAEPDLLLLDEPTNNMDQAGREAVYALLERWRGGLVVASHDRALLDRVDHILELTPQGVHVTAGGWSHYVEARAARLEQAEARLHQVEARAAALATAARRRAEVQQKRDARGRKDRSSGSQPNMVLNARQERAEATSGQGARLTAQQAAEAAAAMDEAKSGLERINPQSFDLPPCGLPTGRVVLTVEDLVVQNPGGPRIGPVSFTMKGPARVSLAGPNGSGKTSLLRAIANQSAIKSGKAILARGAPPVLDQHLSLLEGAASLRVNMRRLQPELTENAARAALARFNFRNTQADRLAGQLSGGERLRAALACVFAAETAPELLILDEPTNHLDVDSVEALEQALGTYDGALLVVSHDRAFLGAIGIDETVQLDPSGSQRAR